MTNYKNTNIFLCDKNRLRDSKEQLRDVSYHREKLSMYLEDESAATAVDEDPAATVCDEDEDACAWCDDGGELLVCDGCERAFCRNCLQRHCGSSYVEQALSADVWDGPCCRPPPSVETLVAAAAPRLADESDEEEDASRAEARLLAIESELAAAQEALEAETVERQEAEIRGELAATRADDN